MRWFMSETRYPRRVSGLPESQVTVALRSRRATAVWRTHFDPFRKGKKMTSFSQLWRAAGALGVTLALAVYSIPPAAADQAAESAAILAVDQAWLKAYNAGDAKTVANLYDENAILLPPGAHAVSGRAAIEAFFVKDTAETAKAGLAFSLGPKPSAGSSGNLGWASGTYSVKDQTGKIVDSGKYLSVSVKKNGHWYYLRDTWNSDAVPEAPPAPAPQKK